MDTGLTNKLLKNNILDNFENYMKQYRFYRFIPGVKWTERDANTDTIVSLPKDTNLWSRNLYQHGFRMGGLGGLIFLDVIGEFIVHNPDNDLAYYFNFRDKQRIVQAKKDFEYDKFEFSKEHAITTDIAEIRKIITTNDSDYYKHKAEELDFYAPKR